MNEGDCDSIAAALHDAWLRPRTNPIKPTLLLNTRSVWKSAVTASSSERSPPACRIPNVESASSRASFSFKLLDERIVHGCFVNQHCKQEYTAKRKRGYMGTSPLLTSCLRTTSVESEFVHLNMARRPYGAVPSARSRRPPQPYACNTLSKSRGRTVRGPGQLSYDTDRVRGVS